MGFLKGCGAPEVDVSRELLGRRNGSGRATRRGCRGLPGTAPCRVSSPEQGLCPSEFLPGHQSDIRSFLLERRLKLATETLVLVKDKPPRAAGRAPAGAHSEWPALNGGHSGVS